MLDSVLEDLGRKLMALERITAAVRRAAARLTAKPDSGRGRRLKRELDQELGRYDEAIATAGPLPSLLEALQGRERRRAALAGELGQLDPLERTAAAVDDVAVTAELHALCAEWRRSSRRIQIVRRMLTERLTVERTPEGIRLSGMATFGPLMASIVLSGEMVPPG
ncbi:MAG: hypothetical protein WEG40_02280 [Candidatus Rokuibacteriota bacterium]